jgi:hypothetical protein
MMRSVAGGGEVAVTFAWRGKSVAFSVEPSVVASDRADRGRSHGPGDDRTGHDPPLGRRRNISEEQRDRRVQIRKVIVVWEKFNDAQTSVAEEAGATAALFRYADGKEPEAVALRMALVNYLKAAIHEEWLAMGRESEAHGVTQALNRLYSAALALNQSGTRDTADMSEVFRQIDNVTAARRVRLHLATGLVPDVIWIALFAGALLTIGFTLFFGSENLLAQVCMTGVFSLLVTLGLVVIISLDHPFTGPVYIHADALSAVLEEFGKP